MKQEQAMPTNRARVAGSRRNLYELDATDRDRLRLMCMPTLPTVAGPVTVRRSLVLLLAVWGCKSSPSPGAEELAAVRDTMCACKDALCTTKAAKEFEVLQAKYDISKHQDLDAIARHYESCRQVLSGPTDAQRPAFASLVRRLCACDSKRCADGVLHDMLAAFPHWPDYAAVFLASTTELSAESRDWRDLFQTVKDCTARYL